MMMRIMRRMARIRREEDDGHFLTLYQLPAGAEESSLEEDSTILVTLPKAVNAAVKKKLKTGAEPKTYDFALESIPENEQAERQ